VIKETIVLAALVFGQIPTVTDGDTVRIAAVASVQREHFRSSRLKLDGGWQKAASERVRQLAQAWSHTVPPTTPQRRSEPHRARIIDQVKLELVPCATSNWGRLCAEGSINDKPLAAHMIARGLASPYVCRPGWCPSKRDWCRK